MLDVRRLSIRAKLIAGLTGCAVLTLCVGAIGTVGLRATNAYTLDIYRGDLVPILRIAEIRQGIHADESALQAVLVSRTPESVQDARTRIHADAQAINKAWSAYAPMIEGDTERAAADALVAARRTLDHLSEQALDHAATGDFDPGHSVTGKDYVTAMALANQSIGALYDENEAQAETSYQQSQRLYQRTLFASLAAVVAGLVVAAGLMAALLRAISLPVRKAVAFAGAIASGRLQQTPMPPRHDEVGQLTAALHAMDKQLTGVVIQVRSGAESVADASRQIAQGNNELSRQAQQQAAALEETAAAMEEMTVSVRQTASHARHADTLTAAALSRAETGQVVTRDAVAAMQHIETSSRSIVDIVGLIDELSFQTNLLSLNAAIEAARAGQEGRGFAVVAAEVRRLAQRSAQSAQEIRSLITEAVEKVATGSALVGVSAQALDEIVQHVREASDVVKQIAEGSAEQSLGIEQVNSSVTALDNGLQGTAALVEQAAAASQLLHTQASELKGRVDFFELEGNREQPVPEHDYA
jgi:methyl-accepting chemotaxis protein-1 (serine sensor receptor)